jgi:hypothetical protein
MKCCLNFSKAMLMLLSLTLIFTSFMSVAQSKNDQAKTYFYAAEVAYEEQNYSDALVALTQVESIMGKSGAKLAALRIKIYADQQQWTKAKKALNAFYSFSPKANFARKMSPYLIKVDNGLKEKEKQIARQQQQRIAENLAEQRRQNRLRAERIASEERLKKKRAYDAEQQLLRKERENKQRIAKLRKAKQQSKSPSKYSVLPKDIVAWRGTVIITGPKEGNAWLMMISGRNNELMWEFNYSHKDKKGNRINLSPTSVFVHDFKGIFIAGKAENSMTGAETGFVINVDRDGKLIWIKQYQHPSGSGWSSFEDITAIFKNNYAELSGDDLILTGVSSKESPPQVWVVRINHKGNEIWNKTYGGEGYEHGYHAIKTKDNDGSVLIAATTDSKGAGKSDAWLLQLDNEGTVIWEKTYGGTNLDIIKSAATDKQGNFYMSGLSLDEKCGRCIWAFKTNNIGELQWDKKFEGFSGYSIHRTHDNNMIIGGLGKYSKARPLTAIKITKQGEIIWRQELLLPGRDIWPSKSSLLVVDDVMDGYYMTALDAGTLWVKYVLEPENE